MHKCQQKILNKNEITYSWFLKCVTLSKTKFSLIYGCWLAALTKKLYNFYYNIFNVKVNAMKTFKVKQDS